MSTLRTLTVALALVTLSAVSVAAQPTIGIYFDSGMNSQTFAVDPQQEFDIYLIMSSINDRANAVEYKLNLPSQVAVLETTYGGQNPLDLGNSTDGTILGFGGCEFIFDNSPQETFVVAHMRAVAVTTFEATPVTVTKYTGGGAGNPGVNGPRYANCDAGEFEMQSSDAQLTGGVPTYSRSFGAVKSLYE